MKKKYLIREIISAIMVLLLTIVPVFSIPVKSVMNIELNEKVYVSDPSSLVNISFMVPFSNPFMNLSIVSCEKCNAYHNSTYLIIMPTISKLHKGINNISVKLHLSQRLILPYKEHIQSYEEYIKPTKNIFWSNTEIPSISMSIRRKCGNDTLCMISEAVEWVNSFLTYDLQYGDKNYNTSWILSHKKGVCAEYTTLFISLMRSLNIPSRYISSLVYDKKSSKLIPHAYAEVLINGTWYPIDVLWKEIGFVDAFHIGRGSNKDNQIKSKINVKYKGDIEIKWLQEKFSLVNISIRNARLFSINNASFRIVPNKTQEIKLNITKNYDLKMACVPYAIYECKGIEKIYLYPKKGITCDNLISFNISIVDENVICPVIIKYIDEVSMINITTLHSTQDYLSDTSYFLVSFIESLKKFFMKIISLISSS